MASFLFIVMLISSPMKYRLRPGVILTKRNVISDNKIRILHGVFLLFTQLKKHVFSDKQSPEFHDKKSKSNTDLRGDPQMKICMDVDKPYFLAVKRQVIIGQ